MLDEEQRIAVKLAQATAIPTNWREHPPRPFANEAAIQQLFVPLQNQQKELEEQKIRLGLVKEQRNQAEASLNDYEQKHPELFDKKKNPPWLFIAAGVSFILAFFLPIPLRYILIAAAIICGVGGTLKQNKPVNKDTWQEKLGQLDVYEGQVVEMTEKVTRSQQKVQHLSDQIQTELRHRNMSNAENEFAVVQENQRAQNYLAQLQTSKELQQRQSSLRQNLMQQEQRFEFLAEWLPLNQKNLSEKLLVLEQFAKEMEQIRFAQTYQENTLLQQRIHETQKQQQQLLTQEQSVLDKFHLTYPSEIPAFLQRETELRHKQTRLKELTESVLSLFEQETSLAEINESLRTLQQEIQIGEQQLHQLQEQEQRSRLQIQQMQADGTLDSLYQQASQQRAVIEKLTADYAVAKLENQLLQDIATELSEQQLPELLKQATSYFQELTNNAHSRLDF